LIAKDENGAEPSDAENERVCHESCSEQHAPRQPLSSLILYVGQNKMTSSRDQRAKEIQDAIREVLNRDWDPIRVVEDGIEDEYDSYIGQIYRLLTSTPSRDIIASELRRIEFQSMGFSQAKIETFFPTAEKLLAIDIRITE